MHNVDYGFARNLTGMRPIWIGFILISTVTCWISYFLIDANVLGWAIGSTLVALILCPVAFCVLPGYVRTKSTYYAESFFGTLTAVDRVEAE